MKTKPNPSASLSMSLWNGIASVVLFVVSLSLFSGHASAQCPPSLRFNTGVPGNPVGFEIDGDYFISPSGTTQDWSDIGVTGRSVLFEDAATGNAVPGSRSMSDQQYSKWLQDENWGCPGCTDYSQFNGSSNKNGDDISAATNNWTYSSNGQAPQKNDITNAMVFFKRQGGETWLIGGAETRAVNGDAHLDFEYNQKGVYLSGSQTAGFIKGNGMVKGRTVGDFLVSIDYELGGTCPRFALYVWNSQGRWVSQPIAPGVDYFFSANVGAAPIDAVAPGYGVTPAGLPSNTTERLQFVEFAVKSSAIDALLNNICNDSATVTVKTRSSTSFTAELKDFVFFSFGNPPILDCSPDQCVCQLPNGNTFTVSDGNCNSNYVYTWSVDAITGGITANIQNPNSCSTTVTTSGSGLVVLKLKAEYNGCYDSCYTTLTVNPTPPCTITGPQSVQPNTTNTYTGPQNAQYWVWSVTGAGTIVGSNTERTVQVAANPNCGTYALTLQTSNDGCTPGSRCSTDACTLEVTVEPCNQLCTYTQGAYGNAGGRHCNGLTTPDFMMGLLSTPLTIGSGAKTVTFTSSDVSCLISKLPAGGTPRALNNSYTCANIQPISSGKINNILIGQTIVLGLNMRIPGNSLADLRLTGRYITTADGNGSGCSSAGSAVSGSERTYMIPQSVLSYLGTNNRVSDLFALANAALGGTYVPNGSGPGYSAINNAVDAINNAFDDCRLLVGFSNTTRNNQGLNAGRDQALTVYPNPFRNQLNIRVETIENKPLHIEILNIDGSRIASVFEGDATLSGILDFQFDGQDLPEGVYLCRVRTGDRIEIQRVVLYRRD